METVAARDYGHQGIPSVVMAYVKGQKPKSTCVNATGSSLPGSLEVSSCLHAHPSEHTRANTSAIQVTICGSGPNITMQRNASSNSAEWV